MPDTRSPAETPFWEACERMKDMARRSGFGPFGHAPLGWRFEIPLAVWEAAKVVVGEYGWTTDPPLGYRIIGYPFVVDPNMPADGLRLVAYDWSATDPHGGSWVHDQYLRRGAQPTEGGSR